MDEKIIESARKIAEVAVEGEPAITEAYLFPAEGEIRLIYVDPTTIPNDERINPYYFPPDPQDGVPYPSAVALILPEEKGCIALPENWGIWSDGILIYKKISTPQQNYIDFMFHLNSITIELAKSLIFDKHHVWHRSLMLLYGTIREIYCSVCVLVQEAIDCKCSGIGINILLRSALEAFVDLILLVNDREYCDYMRVAELAQWIKIKKAAKETSNFFLKQIANEPNLDKTLQHDQDEIKDLKRKNVKLLSPRQKFEKAGLSEIYDSVYNFLCCDSHNNIRALQSRHLRIAQNQSDFHIESFSPFRVADYLGELDLLCFILLTATEKIHAVLGGSSMNRINELKKELDKRRQEIGLN